MTNNWVLAIQGGGQRAVFACGAADVLIEEGLFASEVYGCSAGNWIGLNYIQKKKGAAYKLFRDTKIRHILSPLEFAKGRSLINFDHYFSEKKNKDLDKDLVENNEICYYAVATDMRTNTPLYVSQKDPFFWEACEASCSLTMYRRSPMMVGNVPALDGGYVERIPFLRPFSEGKKVVVISNREKGFRFESLNESNEASVMKRFKDYPEFVNGYSGSHIRYHEQLRVLEDAEKEGKIFAIYPPRSVNLSITNQDENALREAYELGVATAKQILPSLRNYLSD